MHVSNQPFPVQSIIHRKDNIDPKPQYQRTSVWSTQKKQLLIDTIMRRYDMPKIYLRVLDPGGDFDYEVVDGQQRLRAIWEFHDNRYPLSEVSNDIPGEPELAGKYFRDLLPDHKDKFTSFVLQIAEIRDASDIEIRELFLRLQEGLSLIPAEKRNAMIGNMRDFIAELAENHAVFPRTKINKKRFGMHDLAAHVTCLELHSGPVDVKAPDLKAMYQNTQTFNSSGPEGTRIKKILKYMSRILLVDTPEMNIKWGFVDLYLAISRLIEEYVLRNREDEFHAFYVGFENERRDVDDPAALLEGSPTWWDRDLYNYIAAFQREGATRDNLQKRHDVYVRRIMRDIPDLDPVDPQRAFSDDQRVVIWRRDNGTCQACSSDVPFEEMHADHIIPHSGGGKTIVENGQTMCAPCNLSRGAPT